nr:TIM barrel protein [Corynebacterium lactis]
MITAINCSTVYAHLTPAEAVAAARADGYGAVEFWWPFPEAVPEAHAVEEFCSLFGPEVRLHALNLWGGDMAAGQRGVLHDGGLPEGHLDVVRQIAEATGLRCSNVLLGRSGGAVTRQQVERLRSVAAELRSFGVEAMVEPLSGMGDYPVTDPWAATEVARAADCGVLLDFYHLAVNGVDVERYLADVESGELPLPAHVQVADFPGRGAPGSATLPLEEWVGRLRAAGYAGEVAGEWTS